MKTTLQELNQLFGLKSTDFKTIKKGLVNKIKVVDADNVEVTDEGVKELLEKFRNGGACDAEEAAKLFHISKGKILELAKKRLIPSYELHASKGSKTLFLKAELEKENTLRLVHYNRQNYEKFAEFLKNIFSNIAKERQFDQRKFEMYRMHYFEYLTLEEIASEMGITRERVRACTEYIRRKIISAMSHYETVYKRNKELEILNAELQNFIEKQLKINKFFLFTEEDIARLKQNVFLSEAQIEHLKQTGFFTQEQIALLIESAGKIEAEAAARAASPKIIDMDISVRILNCLKAADIETLYDLRKYKKEDMLKFRNIGKKSLAELTEVMRRYGIEW